MKIVSSVDDSSLLQVVSFGNEIQEEPMLYGSDIDFAYDNGKRLTRDFLGCLPVKVRDDPTLLLDSRTQMMMPGWFGCIPGWHMDHRPRPTGQPDLGAPSEAYHWLCVLGCAPTEFAVGTFEFRPPRNDVYKALHRRTDEAIAEGDAEVFIGSLGRVYGFDSLAVHRGVRAQERAWRWFVRASIGTGRSPANEIRRQTQIYIPSEEAGW